MIKERERRRGEERKQQKDLLLFFLFYPPLSTPSYVEIERRCLGSSGAAESNASEDCCGSHKSETHLQRSKAERQGGKRDGEDESEGK